MFRHHFGRVTTHILASVFYQIQFMLLFSAFSFYAHAQSIESILPVGLNHRFYESLPVLLLPSIDSAVIQTRQQQARYTKEKYIGYNFQTDFSPHADDTLWGVYSPSYRSWHLKLKSTGAYGMALVFSNVKLLPQEKLFVYNLRGMMGPFTRQTISQSGVLPLNFLEGDEIVIEFDSPLGAAQTGTFTIETVSHAYQNIFVWNTSLKATTDPAKRKNETIDSNCYVCLEGDTLQQSKRAVVKLTIYFDGGTKECTGTLVTNTAEDKSPYVITAQHCISSQAEAQRTVFTFNYEYLSCNGTATADNFTLNGSSYLASYYKNDFSIVRLNDYPPLNYHPYYAGWDIRDNEKDDVMTIHHPEGGPKQISMFQGTVVPHDFDDQTSRAPNGFWRISKWDAGATEGGSSGAPLFNKDRRVMGTLTGGSSECGSPFNDYFQRLSQSWEPSARADQQLKRWLDPLSSGIKSMNGMDPFAGIISECDTLSNTSPEEILDLIPYSSGVGYYSGYNVDHVATYAEKFYTSDSIMLTGTLFNVGSLNRNSTGGIVVTVHQNDQGLPGAALYQTYIPYSRLDSGANYIAFYPYLNIKGTFFISYTISYSPKDSFALLQSPWRNSRESTAFVKLPSGWVSIKNISPVSMGASFAIQIFACKQVPAHVSTGDKSLFSIYPNPSSAILIVKFQELILEKFELQVFDLQGRMQNASYYQTDNNILINISALSSGMYILHVKANDKVYQAKFLKFQ